MEKAKLDWKTFTGRRRLDVAMWLKSKGIKSFAELKAWCESKDMVPPEKEEVKAHFAAPKKPTKKVAPVVVEEKKEEKAPEAPKEEVAPPVKARRVRTKKKVDAEE